MCIDPAILRDPRLDMVTLSQYKRLMNIVANMETLAGSVFTEADLKRYFRMRPAKWDPFFAQLRGWGWFERRSEDCYVCAGILAPAPAHTTEEAADSPGAIRMRENHLVAKMEKMMRDQLAEMRQSLGLSAQTEQNAEQTAFNRRTSTLEEAHNGPLDSERAAPDGESQLINQSIDSKHSLENSNSIELIDDPVADHRAYLDRKLIELRMKREEIPGFFAAHSLEYLAAGIECVTLGFWKKSKTGYDSAVSLRNYLLGKLDLPYSYQNLVSKRRQTAMDLLVLTKDHSPPAEKPAPPAASANGASRNRDSADSTRRAVAETLSDLSEEDQAAAHELAIASLDEVWRERIRHKRSTGAALSDPETAVLNSALYAVLLRGESDGPQYATG